MLIFSTIIFSTGCQAQSNSPKEEEAIYSYTKENRDGIGKWYMGREISHVMGHLGASWLERPERELEERTDLLIENLGLKPTDVVVDLGAGTGYFSFKMAQLVPQGKVIAADIQQEMLDMVTARKEELNISNVETLLCTEKDPKLDPNSIDAVLIVDVYHEIEYPREVMKKIVEALRPDGRLILVEYRAEDPMVPIKRLHKMSLAQAEKEMKAVGLKLKENKNMLPRQHLMIFVKD